MLGTLNTEQIEHVLRTQVIGHIGCHAEGQTYVVPVTYAYDGHSVYAHSTEGMKISMMRKNPRVCFEVERVDNLASWQSVIAWGTYEELSGDDAARGMRFLVHRLLPAMSDEHGAPAHAMRGAHEADTAHAPAVIYRINLEAKTGRFERR